ncbi:MAG: DNA recombination protein RmuC [Dehalococcoidia bacterium]
MEAVIVVLLVALIGAVAGVGVYVSAGRRRPDAPEETEAQPLETQLAALRGDISQQISQGLSMTQQTVLAQVNAVDTRLNQRFDAVQTTVGQRFDAVQSDIGRSLTSQSETIGKIGAQLGELAQSTQQMLDVGKNISSLQDILKPPKVRGGFGEMLLERLLAEILPENSYSTQHRFTNGVIVDAAIHVGSSIVPVDSKFPLESFHRVLAAPEEERSTVRKEFVRAVRGHIDAVAKYILPDEGSLPFALMYIPAENVYYEVIVKDDLGDAQANLCAYAMERRVIPVSPNSFYAYLQAILIGLNGMKVEERAHEIISHLERLNGDFARMKDDFTLVGKHLRNAAERYGDVDRSFTKFGDRLAASVQGPVQTQLPDLERDALPEPSEIPATTMRPLPASIGNGGDDRN